MYENKWIGDYNYIIKFYNGTHEVRRYETTGDYTVVFSGHYEKCLHYLKEIEIAYLESLF